MRKFFILFISCLFFLLIAGCGSDDRELEEKITQVRQITRSALDLDPKDKSPFDYLTARYETLSRAAYELRKLQEESPFSLLSQGIKAGTLDVGGMTSGELLEEELPRLELKIKALQDPLSAATVLIPEIKDVARRSELYGELVDGLLYAGHVSQAETLVAQIIAHLNEQPPSRKAVTQLCSLAMLAYESGRKAQALRIAFQALSLAKSIPTVSERNSALGKVAVTYYSLGVEQKGFEALQSIPSPIERMGTLEEVIQELSDKNLYHQSLAASTIVFDSEKRAIFLARMAELASEKDLNQSVALFLESAVALLPRITLSEAKVSLLLKLSRLSKDIDENSQAIQLLTQASDGIDAVQDPSVVLAAQLADELFRSKKTSASKELTAATIERIKKLPASLPREQAIIICARVLTKLDDREKALSLSRLPKLALKDKLLVLLEIAANSPVSERTSIRELTKEVEEDYPDLETQPDKVEILLKLRDTLIRVEDIEEAKRISLLLRNEDKRWRTYSRSFCEMLLEKGYVSEAIGLARSVDDIYLRGILLAEIAKKRAKDNSINEAVTLLEEAGNTIDKGKDPKRNQAIAALFADTMLQIRWPVLALSLIESHDLPGKVLWYARVAEAYRLNGQTTEARDTLLKGFALLKPEWPTDELASTFIELGKVHAKLGGSSAIDIHIELSRLIGRPLVDATRR